MLPKHSFLPFPHFLSKEVFPLPYKHIVHYFDLLVNLIVKSFLLFLQSISLTISALSCTIKTMKGVYIYVNV